GALADLERALLSYVNDVVEKAGFRPVFVPDVVNRSVTEACGLQQRSEQGIQYPLSRCYRPEVSKNAWEARLYRVHEFTKFLDKSQWRRLKCGSDDAAH
ncbi:hypothetical protein Tcan_07004, partial [Toxocara canis]